MIIKYPTALYEPVLPQQPSDRSNVTFTISNSSPPRSSLVFSELPPAIENLRRPPRTLTPEERREDVSERAFTVLKSGLSNAGSNKKIVEIGQVLEFVDSPDSTLQPMLVTKDNEFQHDTNILDLTSLGISQMDQEEIDQSANALMEQLTSDLNLLIRRRSDLEVAIAENKKDQNENKKAINAIQVLVDNGQEDLQYVIDDLTIQGEELLQQEADLIAAANEVADLSTAKINEIRKLTEVVR
jgi:hypothetical protein